MQYPTSGAKDANKRRVKYIMKLVEFQFEHLDLFEFRDEEKDIYNVGSEFMQAIIKAGERGEVYTAIHDGRILVIGGVIPRSKKTGYAFTFFSKHANAAPITAAKLVKRMFVRLMEDMKLHRVTTYNMVKMPAHSRWCEWLGMEKEGLIRRMDDAGNDYYQYGMVIDGV